jgi:hypothetical protein
MPITTTKFDATVGDAFWFGLCADEEATSSVGVALIPGYRNAQIRQRIVAGCL